MFVPIIFYEYSRNPSLSPNVPTHSQCLSSYVTSDLQGKQGRRFFLSEPSGFLLPAATPSSHHRPGPGALTPLGHLLPGVRVQQGLALSAATDLKRASVLNRNRLRTIGHSITYCQNINSEVKKSILFNLVSHHSQESPIEAQKEKKLNHTHHPWIQLFYCLQATWASTDLMRIHVSVQVGHYLAL